MAAPEPSETIDETHTTTTRTLTCDDDEIEHLEELQDATTNMLPQTHSRLESFYEVFLAELNGLKKQIIDRDVRIAKLLSLRMRFREEVEKHQRTHRKYEKDIADYEQQIAKQKEDSGAAHQEALRALEASLGEKISRLTKERDEQRKRLEEITTTLLQEQADLRDLRDELAEKEKTIKSLHEKAEQTQVAHHSEIEALKDTVAQRTAQISALLAEIEQERLKRQEAEDNFAVRWRALETELERKSTAYQKQAADAESRHQAELEARDLELAAERLHFEEHVRDLERRLEAEATRSRDELTRSRDELKTVKKELRDRDEDIESQRVAMEHIEASFRTRISEADTKFQQEILTIQDRLRREQSDKASLRSDNEDLRSKNNRLSSDAMHVTQELSNAVAKYQEEHKLRTEREATIEAMRADAERAERAQDALRTKNAELQSELSLSLKKIENLQERLQTVQAAAEKSERDSGERIRVLESDLTSAHRELESARDKLTRLSRTSQAEIERLQDEIRELQTQLEAVRSDSSLSNTASRKEIESLRSQIASLQEDLRRSRADADTSAAEIQRLRAQLAKSQEQFQDAAKRMVTDIEFKFQERLQNSRAEIKQLVTVIMERDMLIVRMREEIIRITKDTKTQIIRIENRHREEEQTFYRRLEEKDETIAALERENLRDRTDRSTAFTRAAAKIQEELHYIQDIEGAYLKTDAEMNQLASETTEYSSQVKKMQADYLQNIASMFTTVDGKDFMGSSSSTVTAEVTLRPREVGKGYEPEQMSVGSEEKTQSERSEVVTGPNGKPRTVRTKEETTKTTKVTATADGKVSQTFKYWADKTAS